MLMPGFRSIHFPGKATVSLISSNLIFSTDQEVFCRKIVDPFPSSRYNIIYYFFYGAAKVLDMSKGGLNTGGS